jgi:hypothetical protein
MNFQQIHTIVKYLKENNKMYMIDDIIKSFTPKTIVEIAQVEPVSQTINDSK